MKSLLFLHSLISLILSQDVQSFTTLANQCQPVFVGIRDRLKSGSPLCSSSVKRRSSSAASSRRDEEQRNSTRQPSQSSTRRRSGQTQTWRIFGLEVHPDLLESSCSATGPKDPNGKESTGEKTYLNGAVINALLRRLKLSETTKDCDYQAKLAEVGIADVRVVRRSIDARQKQRSDGGSGPRFVYVLDVDLPPGTIYRWKHQPGRMELMLPPKIQSSSPAPRLDDAKPRLECRVIVVGAGPAGLFASLVLAQAGIQTILLERGKPVELRGKDIGALIHRRSLDSESNFCFGEGGAGTWSDGKLTTRIGRNSDSVRGVLDKLVQYGAPPKILVEGAPHLGTDNLVKLLRNMRRDLRRMGGEIRFGTKMINLIIEDGVVKGVEYESQHVVERNQGEDVPLVAYSDKGTILGDAVILATGHSARDVYEKLHNSGVLLEAKGFAVGFRVEHPQKLINKIQYGTEWGPFVSTGKATTDKANTEYFSGLLEGSINHGRVPVPSYRLATDQAFDGSKNRGAYSFCMCPGGQIVPTSLNPDELCVNGMSFSRRDSLWANSAIVVTVSPDDSVLDPYRVKYGVLAGVAFQRDMEQRAAVMGGGNFIAPVQRVTDFIVGRPSTTAPPSSYRLGVRPSALHEIYPPSIVDAMRDALINHFEKKMPGYICDEALLHGVETRTSSPVRISRDDETMQAIGAQGLYPAGEGAGYAGGIVSAAVDGLVIAERLLDSFLGRKSEATGISRRAVNIGDSFY